MRFKSFIAVFLIVGFLISLHCRTEAETISYSHGSESEMSDQKDGNNSPPWEPKPSAGRSQGSARLLS
jgi:hypothetical protein